MATNDENESLDATVAQLQEAADQILNTEDESNDEPGKTEALKNVARIVKDTASKGIGSSKAYLAKVLEKVETYAHDASDTASTHLSGVQENITKAIQAGSSSNASAGGDGVTARSIDSDDEPIAFPYNVVTWCTSICGKAKETAKSAKEVSIESLKTAADHVSTTLKDHAKKSKPATSQAEE